MNLITRALDIFTEYPEAANPAAMVTVTLIRAFPAPETTKFFGYLLFGKTTVTKERINTFESRSIRFVFESYRTL